MKSESLDSALGVRSALSVGRVQPDVLVVGLELVVYRFDSDGSILVERVRDSRNLSVIVHPERLIRWHLNQLRIAMSSRRIRCPV